MTPPNPTPETHDRPRNRAERRGQRDRTERHDKEASTVSEPRKAHRSPRFTGASRHRGSGHGRR